MSEFATLDFMAEVIDALGLKGRSITRLQITLDWVEAPCVTMDIVEYPDAESVERLEPILRRYRWNKLVGGLRSAEEVKDHEQT